MKGAILLALGIAGFALPAQAQEVEPRSSNSPAYEDSRLDKTLEKAERDAAGAGGNTREARLALESYGRCTAERERGEAARVLAMDFTKPTYRTGLRMLSQEAERECAKPAVGPGGVMRGSNLLFAGEVAEALLEAGPDPVGPRLAKAATVTGAQGFSPTDKVALCIVRSVPDQVAGLFATDRESAAETAAIGALDMPLRLCTRAAAITTPMTISPAGLRAMLATAAFRSIASAKIS